MVAHQFGIRLVEATHVVAAEKETMPRSHGWLWRRWTGRWRRRWRRGWWARRRAGRWRRGRTWRRWAGWKQRVAVAHAVDARVRHTSTVVAVVGWFGGVIQVRGVGAGASGQLHKRGRAVRACHHASTLCDVDAQGVVAGQLHGCTKLCLGVLRWQMRM